MRQNNEVLWISRWFGETGGLPYDMSWETECTLRTHELRNAMRTKGQHGASALEIV